jgi:hypothetical protein
MSSSGQRRFVNGSVENAVRDTGGPAELANRVVKEAWAPLAPRVGAGPGRTRSS